LFDKGIHLFTLFGFEVRLNWTWLILAVLITWSLATGFFPAYSPDMQTSTYWWMGVVGTIGLFFSIVFHELSHSLVARRYGIPMHGITLFVFGGMAQMHQEPHNPKSEILMSLAGPIASIIIGLVFLGVNYIGGQAFGQTAVGVVIGYLGIINLILAAFNLIPAFPLDGGRILRSVLWARGKDLRKATRISSRIGSGFGIFLIVMGVLDFIGGNFIGGVWLALIGMFLRSISKNSYQQLLMRKALEGEPIKRFMKTDPVTVEPSITLEDLVENYIYRYHHKLYPVTRNGELLGCVSLPQVKQFSREQWEKHTVDDVVRKCDENNTVDENTDSVRIMSRMRKNGKSRMIVTKNGQLAGVITLKDLLEFLSLKVDLEEVA